MTQPTTDTVSPKIKALNWVIIALVLILLLTGLYSVFKPNTIVTTQADLARVEAKADAALKVADAASATAGKAMKAADEAFTTAKAAEAAASKCASTCGGAKKSTAPAKKTVVRKAEKPAPRVPTPPAPPAPQASAPCADCTPVAELKARVKSSVCGLRVVSGADANKVEGLFLLQPYRLENMSADAKKYPEQVGSLQILQVSELVMGATSVNRQIAPVKFTECSEALDYVEANWATFLQAFKLPAHCKPKRA